MAPQRASALNKVPRRAPTRCLAQRRTLAHLLALRVLAAVPLAAPFQALAALGCIASALEGCMEKQEEMLRGGSRAQQRKQWQEEQQQRRRVGRSLTRRFRLAKPIQQPAHAGCRGTVGRAPGSRSRMPRPCGHRGSGTRQSRRSCCAQGWDRRVHRPQACICASAAPPSPQQSHKHRAPVLGAVGVAGPGCRVSGSGWRQRHKRRRRHQQQRGPRRCLHRCPLPATACQVLAAPVCASELRGASQDCAVS